MIARSSGIGLNELAERAFQFFTHLSLALPLGRRRGAGELKEMEFLALSILRQNQMMIVGDIQRILGVLPAQMSRIIRSLEGRESPLIACQINPHDKRKIDVQLTEAGEKALEEFAAPRLRVLSDLFAKLSDEERESLAHLLDRLQDLAEEQSHQ